MNILNKKLNQLDDVQRRAYESNKNTIISAGPGSGKTTLITLKIAKLLSEIPLPRGLACITFKLPRVLLMKK
ncbi:hypothetical protein CW357_07045 [Rummeliibacillus sp. TYF005]|uniref:UvrD-helicase domain-containing protein n=1 Tax=unclassified Rummeliibacillus TaxID=2622809 RepID=UPI000E666171|nr:MULTISPECIES: UvrD-helicase domain-containing protein [unclassified Rummeliibacillus]RIJ62932.1 hypothetical protein D1606_17565 [Rummeliibacillus sp. POC4]RPJ96099.1 hypothetical protein CW357_07045 [Rummeliibacillus sp. TYF005]